MRELKVIAAIAGGLAGALYGYGSIPIECRKKRIKREYIEDMCQTASEKWFNQLNVKWFCVIVNISLYNEKIEDTLSRGVSDCYLKGVLIWKLHL